MSEPIASVPLDKANRLLSVAGMPRHSRAA
jgi:hypothetical protein